MYVTLYTYVEGGLPSWVEYRQIKGLKYAPDVDVTGNSLPIPGFEVDIITTDDLSGVDYAVLSDDLDQEWCSYDVTFAERVDANTVHVKAQNILYKLEYVELEPAMYNGAAASVVVAGIFDGVTAEYDLHEDLQNIPITGFCPAQTARERLAWVCFAIGAYVRATFVNTAQIQPVDETGDVVVPYNRTFWRPTVSYEEWVTAVKVTTYTFRQAASEQEWRDSDSSYMFPLPWIATEQVVTLANPSAPARAPENVKEIEGVYLVNPSNVSGIVSRLAKYWFKRETVALDCINNREYAPGDLVTVAVDDTTMMRGYIQSSSWRFGVQARSTLKLIGAEARTGARLTINYLYSGGRIGQAVYFLPVEYVYSIENPFLDRTWEGRRYVYRPEDEAATGTIAAGENVDNEDYDVALEWCRNVLAVYYVDGIEAESSGGDTIGVIT